MDDVLYDHVTRLYDDGDGLITTLLNKEGSPVPDAVVRLTVFEPADLAALKRSLTDKRVRVTVVLLTD